jgi:uncharacterized protein (UPF0248 family)
MLSPSLSIIEPDGLLKTHKFSKSSFRRKLKSSHINMFWMPDQKSGMTDCYFLRNYQAGITSKNSMKSVHRILGPCGHTIMRYMWLFVVLWMVLVTSSIAGPFASVTVRSVYMDTRTGNWGKDVLWQFSWEDRGKTIVVRQDGDEQAMVRLMYRENGTVQRMWKRIRGNEVMETPAAAILLSNGYPVPYDTLGAIREGSGEIVIKRRAGGVRFSFKVTREVARISLAEARSQGMVDQAGVLDAHDLRIITIRKAGRLMVRQLWAAGDSFWLYEETPIRRSWRVSRSE